MLQAAVILGATKIGIIGIDLVAPKEGTMHCYEDGGSRKGATIQKDGKTMAPEVTYKVFHNASRELKSRNIEVSNLSPTKGTAFAKVFGHRSYADFMDDL